MTPFSGISLILHLAIIGIAKVYYYITGEPETSPRKAPRNTPAATMGRRVFSTAIVLAILVMMLGSFVRAVSTSVREGAREPQIQFIKRQAAAVQNSTWIANVWPGGKEEAGTEQHTPQPTPSVAPSTYTLSY